MSHDAPLLPVTILRPGDHFVVEGPDGMAFYQVSDEGIAHIGNAPLPPGRRPILTDTRGRELTHETELEWLQPGMSVRLYNILRRDDMKTIGDVLKKHDEMGAGYFWQLRNLGRAAAEEIDGFIREWKMAGL